MQVDFYQLGPVPPVQAVVQLAANTLAAGKRLLVVDADAARRGQISEALWAAPPFRGRESFLAHGEAGGPHDARQPILLSEGMEPTNGASFVLLADGRWREGDGEGGGFERVFLLFGEETLEEARACWRMLGEREGLERRYWKQEGGRWVQAA